MPYRLEHSTAADGGGRIATPGPLRARQRITSSILCPTYERAQKVDMLFIDVPISGPSGK